MTERSSGGGAGPPPGSKHKRGRAALGRRGVTKQACGRQRIRSRKRRPSVGRRRACRRSEARVSACGLRRYIGDGHASQPGVPRHRRPGPGPRNGRTRKRAAAGAQPFRRSLVALCERPVSAWSAPAAVLATSATSTRARIVTARIGAATLRYREAAAGIGTVADQGGAERDRAHSRDVARASTTDSRLGDTLCRRLMIGAHRRHGVGEVRGRIRRPAAGTRWAPGAGRWPAAAPRRAIEVDRAERLLHEILDCPEADRFPAV